jgi:hypothetical protein
MLESINIQGFKGFKDTTIGPLRKVNLVVGGQNVGKTSLLEAVYMALSANDHFPFRQAEGGDLQRLARSAIGKGFKWIEVQSSEGVVQRMQSSSEARPHNMTVDTSGGYTGSTWLRNGDRMSTPAAIPLYLPSQGHLVQLFGEVVLLRKKRELISMLKQVEPRLESLDAISPDGEQRIYAEISGLAQALSLPALGHGFGRLLYLFCTLLTVNANLALIDEVESGIHYSALPTLLQGIRSVARDRDVQTLMTTHSWDCLRAACEVFSDSPDDFQVIRLERFEDNIRSVCIGGTQMLRLMAEDMEMR